MPNDRIAVYLIARNRRTKDGGRIAYYWLRWRGPDGAERSKSLGPCAKTTKAAAKTARAEHEEVVNHDRIERLPDRRDSLTLAQFRTMYCDLRARAEGGGKGPHKRHKRLAPKTIKIHDLVLRQLIEHFGPDTLIHDIDGLAADRWYEALVVGKLQGARIDGRAQTDKRLSANSIASACRTIKSIFGWALSKELIRRSPVAEWSGGATAGDPAPYVSLDEFRRLCAVAPEGRRVLFALCRLGGLRLTESLLLPWSGTALDDDGKRHDVGVVWPADGKRGRLLILVGAKGLRYREVPIVDELLEVLRAAYLRAPDKADGVACYPVTANNAGREMVKCRALAGLSQWRKKHQALRASRENDWKVAQVAEDTYAKWLGHSAEVSRKHYTNPTDAEFDAAVA